ncbi:centlein-like [Ylistrum balloti]|uniref:centlein-like n=1 Tax=Ylistrum balloti TaxID=509963 RepID=UPI0029059492|nr:centlein-like [Ylistrum balloti]XP_060068889.1 centlein-like [Ylistrum balloti]
MTNSMSKEEEIVQLQDLNQQLCDELRQCQADKDFVWSLWKKLQVANPDVTKAVSLVVQREKEKSENKDRKVLEILQMKDERIEELQTLVAARTKELGEIAVRRMDNQDNFGKLQTEMDCLRDRNSHLEMQLKSFENREKTKSELHHSTVENLQQKNSELHIRCEKLNADLDSTKKTLADHVAQKANLENKSKMLEADVLEKVSRFEGIIGELEDSKKLLRRYDSQLKQSHKETEFKNQELENIRKELSELWGSHNQLTEHSSQQADLIRQLQSLQQDTQKMMKNAEDAYCMEATSVQDMYTELTHRYDESKKKESDLRHQVHSLRKEIMEKDDIIANLQSKVDRRHRKRNKGSSALNGSFLADDKTDEMDTMMDLEFRVKSMQREINLLQEELAAKDRQIDKLESEQGNSDIEFDVSGLNRRDRTHSTPARDTDKLRPSRPTAPKAGNKRSRSVSPRTQVQDKDVKLRLIKAERSLEDTKNLLKLKNREVEEMKKAHAKRQARLKEANANYKIVKEQLKSMEDEHFGRKKKKGRRADPRDLRTENSDGVWNELAHYKSENRNLLVERASIEEEVDSLRVKTSEDAATIHELRIALTQEKEGRQHDRRKTDLRTQARSDQETEIRLLKSEIQSKDVKLDRIQRELDDLGEEKRNLMEEKRTQKAEILELKQDQAQHRIQTADHKHSIKRLEQELDEERTRCSILQQGKDVAGSKSKHRIRNKDWRTGSRVARQYQKSLNKSIEKMKSVFQNFEDEGWEEVSGSQDEEETESDTLGQAIVSRSRTQLSPSDCTDSSYTSQVKPRPKVKQSLLQRQSTRTRRSVIRNLQKGPRSSQSDAPVSASATSADVARTVVLRETGTSPMNQASSKDIITPSPSPAKLHEQKMAHNHTLRQLKQTKQRVLNLQQQVTNLRDSRAATLKAFQEHKDASQQMESDLHLANQRLRVSKQNIQKMSNEIEKLHKEKAHLESQQILREETSTPAVSVDKHTEQDWKVLEQRLKMSSSEVCRQSASLRQMKQENTGLQEQIRNLQDRINHLERDNNQKRSLIEDTRNKLRIAQDNSRTESNSMEEMETRIKLLQEGADRSRIQADSLKKRLSAITREKKEYEDRFLKAHNDLERKTKLLMDCQNKKMELEDAVRELEATAQQQLRGLANQSEAAIEAAQDKLGVAYGKVQIYQQFVKGLANDLVRRIGQTRSQLKDIQVRKEEEEQIQRQIQNQSHGNASLQKAQSLARNILNLSQSDLDDIMSADGDSIAESDISTDRRLDKKWTKKCEKLMAGKDDFALPLIELFVQKIEERSELLLKLQQTAS